MARICWWLTVVLGCVAFTGIGCMGSRTLGSREHEPPITAAYRRITTFEGLHGQLDFGPPRVKRSTFEPMHVVVPVRAAQSQPQRVEYRFEYFDSSGRPMRPSMDWRYLLLPIQGERLMEGRAIDTAAVDWRLEIRRAK